MEATVDSQQKHSFQAEVKQILHLMIHSLYSNKEIFLRELISNASDAADKLRFEALDNGALMGDDTELSIKVMVDKDNQTLTISDNGIGMSEAEVIQNLGTIARSGTKEFLQSLTGDKAKDSQLIGQFGVGFYSSFIVSDQVTVITRRADAQANEAVKWIGSGEGEYTLEKVTKDARGTDVILHLKDDEKEFLESFRLRSIITKYSDHIAFPVLMEKEANDENDKKSEVEYEAVNQAKALWTRPKNELTDDEYKALYKHISHDFEEPLAWSHNKVEGKLDYTMLLYVPKRAPFDLYQRENKHGLKLYVQRVFIMDDVEQFLPFYLRFVKGIIDTNDLPLNVSREILQDSKQVRTIKSAIAKRVLDTLEKLAKNEPEQYQAFWNEFGLVLKEGPAKDFANKERIAKLLRFATTQDDKPEQTHSLEAYVARMPESQKHIYYVAADTFNAAKNSPHLEIFRKKGIEVLLLSDRIDEWFIASLNEYEGKSIQSVAQGSLDLDEVADESTKKEQEKVENEFKDLIERIKNTLEERVSDVRITHRLTDSPACLVADEQAMTAQMERIMRSVGQSIPSSKPILELNPTHEIITRLNEETDDTQFNRWTTLLLEQAILAEGGQLEDPAQFVKTLNALLIGKN